jgi:hypothetical protein
MFLSMNSSKQYIWAPKTTLHLISTNSSTSHRTSLSLPVPTNQVAEPTWQWTFFLGTPQGTKKMSHPRTKSTTIHSEVLFSWLGRKTTSQKGFVSLFIDDSKTATGCTARNFQSFCAHGKVSVRIGGCLSSISCQAAGRVPDASQ